MDEDLLRREIREALDAIRRPASGLLGSAMARVRLESARGRSRRRSWMLEAGVVILAVAVLGSVAVALHQARRGPAVEATPPPPLAPAPRVEPGAQVAWLTSGVGIDPAGNLVGPLEAADAVRSPDGTRLYAASGKTLTTYSALTGKKEGPVIDLTAPSGSRQMRLSPDGGFLGVLESGATYVVEVVDLQKGRSVARLDLGLAPPKNGPGLLLVGPSARELYVFTDFWRPASVVILGFDGTSLGTIGHVIDKKGGPTVLHCDGMFPPTWSSGGLPIRLLPDGRTLVSYCPSDGRVSWFDLKRHTVTAELVVDLPNPFWLSPVFSPDGSMLYLHEGFTGRGGLQAVDLTKHEIVKKVARGPFQHVLRWLADRFITPVYAGGAMRTAAASPDGDWLYVLVLGEGVQVFRLPELNKKAVWLRALPKAWPPGDGPGAAVWVSGDSRTVYVVGRDQRVYVLRAADGSVVASTPAGKSMSGDFLVFGP
jgi:hypothetical protein